MSIIKIFLTLLLTFSSLYSNEVPSDEELKKMIGRMLLVGFSDEEVNQDSKIVKDIEQYELGGVILFDRFYNDKNKTKNIRSSIQLQQLSSKLKLFSKKPLLVSIDQEGGNVARLKPDYGFANIPSAKQISNLNEVKAKAIYDIQAKMLKNSGINCDFAPVVDLALNPQNRVIYELERSYGSEVSQVVKYANIFMESLANEKIISVLKHFPGHGSSLDDSHKGFVDVSDSWDKKELEPYRKLINSGKVKMIMTAHVFNSHLDKEYPATLSHNVNTKILRYGMGYDGVIISDDLQMKAISEHYTLKETVTLAINSGVDMLLFANQLAEQNTDELISIISEQVRNAFIPLERIIEANRRIEKLHESYISKIMNETKDSEI